jgi:hypothetical protein
MNHFGACQDRAGLIARTHAVSSVDEDCLDAELVQSG